MFKKRAKKSEFGLYCDRLRSAKTDFIRSGAIRSEVTSSAIQTVSCGVRAVGKKYKERDYFA